MSKKAHFFRKILGIPIPSFLLDFATIASDFTFTRASSATRVNENGLIETVTDEGSELITNGGFDTDSDWGKFNATISGGKGDLDGDGQVSLLYQTILTDTKTYQVTFTVSNYNGIGEARVIVDSGAALYTITSNGTFTFTFTHSLVSGAFLFRARTGAIYSIDNVSVKEYTEDDVPRIDYTTSTFVPVLGSEEVINGDFDTDSDWLLGGGANISNGFANYTGSGDLIRQNITTPSGTYKITFTTTGTGYLVVKNYTGGVLYKEYVNVPQGENIIYVQKNEDGIMFQSFGFTSSIDNVSVKEVLSYTAADKGAFLLEPTSTNLIPYSEDFSDASWIGFSKNNGSIPTITSNTGISPSGEQDADRIQWNVGDLGTDNRSFIQSTINVTTASCESLWVKSNTGTNQQIALSLSGTDAQVFTVTDEWQRITNPTSYTSPTAEFWIGMRSDFSGNTSTSGDVLIWGAQLEQLPYATSYIPTSGSTATRAQESCVDATPTINSEEGVLYAEIAGFINDDVVTRVIELSDKSNDNRVILQLTNNINEITTYVIVGGSIQFVSANTVSDVTDFNKIAVKWALNNFAIYINGVELGSSLSGNTFAENTLDSLDFIKAFTSATPFYGNTKDLRIYTEALTDEQLTELTTI